MTPLDWSGFAPMSTPGALTPPTPPPPTLSAPRASSWSSDDACRITGSTYRQLDYWARKALIVPQGHNADGSGTRRRYLFTDLVRMRTVVVLMAAGVSLESIRRAGLPEGAVLTADRCLVLQCERFRVTAVETLPDLIAGRPVACSVLPLFQIHEHLKTKGAWQ